MRRCLSLLAATVVFLAAATVSMAETTKTLTIEYAPTGAEKVQIENLAGTMRVVPGSGDKIVAVATLHAENEKLAATVDFVKVPSEKGRTVLRVGYPVEEHSTFRYPGHECGSASVLGIFGGSESNTEYAGRRVKVSGSKGVLLYADVEVRMPRGNVDATFRNVVGSLHGEGLEGTLMFDTACGNVTLDRLKGRIGADTGSGGITASSIGGSFSGDTGSGDITLDRFDGDDIHCDTGSGDVKVVGAVARRIAANTGSGDVSVLASDIEGLSADTGSGEIKLEASGTRLRSVEADTGSGDVKIYLPPKATFEAIADQGSGSIHNGFEDAQPIIKGREVIGYRRGDAQIRIRVDTGSGDLRLEALR